MKRLFEIETPDHWAAVGVDWLRTFLETPAWQPPSCACDIKITEVLVAADGTLTKMADEKELKESIERLDRYIYDRDIQTEKQVVKRSLLVRQLNRQSEARERTQS